MSKTESIRIRDVGVDDIPAVAQLVRSSFEPDLHPYMIAAQPGWERFLRAIVEHITLHPNHRYVIGEGPDGRLCGFAEFKVSNALGFLSYICVDPAYRGRGLARSLLKELVRSAFVDTVELDVFSDNLPALSLYQHLGFLELEERRWIRAPIPRAMSVRPIRMDNLPAAMAAHREFGFCEFVGQVDEKPFRCGRIGSSVLRCFAADDYNDVTLMGALGAAFAEVTESFAVIGAEDATLPGTTAFKRSLRMRTTDLDAVVGRR